MLQVAACVFVWMGMPEDTCVNVAMFHIQISLWMKFIDAGMGIHARVYAGSCTDTCYAQSLSRAY